MPKISSFPTHRLHIMVDEDDHQWLKQELGGEKAISAVFRMVIKRLRGKKIESPNTPALDLLRDMDIGELSL